MSLWKEHIPRIPGFGPACICMVLMCRHMRKKCRQPNLSHWHPWQHCQQWLSGFQADEADLPRLSLPIQWSFLSRHLSPDNSRTGLSSLCSPSLSCCKGALGRLRSLGTLEAVFVKVTFQPFVCHVSDLIGIRGWSHDEAKVKLITDEPNRHSSTDCLDWNLVGSLYFLKIQGIQQQNRK